jgi:uncharacterized protein
MTALAVVGTAAMFLVGGGILEHGIPPLHHAAERLGAAAGSVAGIGPLLKALAPLLLDALIGIVAGGVVLAVVTLGKRLFGRKHAVAA